MRNSGPLTVGRAAEVYLEKLEAKNPRTARDTRGRLKLHFLNKFGDELVTSLTKSKLEGWLNSMALKSQDREAVRRSKDSANRVLSMVKALLNHALHDSANGITDDHAWRLVKPYHGVATPRATHFSEAQARALIEATPDREFADLLTAGFLTGARYGELIACSIRDFDEAARTLSVDGKTGPRTIVLRSAGRGRPRAFAALFRAHGNAADRAPDPTGLQSAGRQNLGCMGWNRVFLLAKARLSELSHPQAVQRQDRELS